MPSPAQRLRSWREASGPPSARRVRQQEAVQASRKEPLKHSFSFGMGTSPTARGLLTICLRPAAGPRGGSVHIWLGSPGGIRGNQAGAVSPRREP